MIFYFLPDTGIFGGVKVACQLADMLNGLGIPVAVAFPDGRAPEWFPFAAPVLSDAEAIRALGPEDWAVLTWPPDHKRLAPFPGRRIVHTQGTDPLMDPLLADPSALVLTCWSFAADYARRMGARPVEIGISISPPFFFDHREKLFNRVAYMPRRGYATVRSCMRACPWLDFAPIEGLDEAATASLMQNSGVFLATAKGEQFGLPALEAMAAGCLVLSVPVVGGMEYLHHGENCLVAEPDELASVLAEAMLPENRARNERLRAAGLATAWQYHPERQRRRLAALLGDQLAILRPNGSGP